MFQFCQSHVNVQKFSKSTILNTFVHYKENEWRTEKNMRSFPLRDYDCEELSGGILSGEDGIGL